MLVSPICLHIWSVNMDKTHNRPYFVSCDRRGSPTYGTPHGSDGKENVTVKSLPLDSETCHECKQMCVWMACWMVNSGSRIVNPRSRIVNLRSRIVNPRARIYNREFQPCLLLWGAAAVRPHRQLIKLLSGLPNCVSWYRQENIRTGRLEICLNSTGPDRLQGQIKYELAN